MPASARPASGSTHDPRRRQYSEGILRCSYYPDNPQSCITLSPIVLDELKRMSAGPLKVYIYISACYKGQPFSAPIRQFKSATGLGQRSVIAALKALREKKLITCISGRGNQPNQYCIPLPRRKETAAPPAIDTLPNPGLRPAKVASRNPGASDYAGAPNCASECEIRSAHGNHHNPDAGDHPRAHSHLLSPDKCPGVRSGQTGALGRSGPPRKVGAVQAPRRWRRAGHEPWLLHPSIEAVRLDAGFQWIWPHRAVTRMSRATRKIGGQVTHWVLHSPNSDNPSRAEPEASQKAVSGQCPDSR
jgi:hypothetical protein